MDEPDVTLTHVHCVVDGAGFAGPPHVCEFVAHGVDLQSVV